MSNIIETTTYDELEDRMVVKTTYDNTDVLEANKEARINRGVNKYKGNLVHVGCFDIGDVVRLHNMGYKLLSSDPEEVKRALLYIQSNEPWLLTVEGRPFAKRMAKWV